MFHTRSLISFVTLAGLLGSANAAIGPVTDLHIVNANVSPDGFARNTVLPAGTVDRTIISGNKGDAFKINVINDLNDNTMLQSTSIHWHGILQNGGSNWADGAAFVNQCPIVKGNSFLYSFTANDAGTFWYHSHLSTQYCDGLRGPLVVYDPNDPNKALYDVDDDTTVLTLSDWYHTLAKNAGAVPTPDAALINGLGRYSGGPTSALAVISVTQGKRYRFRLVNMACDPNYLFQIDSHTFNVIEADGVNHVPVVADAIPIFAGQRYSFILNANQTVGNYWIRANPNVGTKGFTGGLNSAILRYVGAPVADPTGSVATPAAQLSELSLHPLVNPGAPGTPVVGGADIVKNLAITFTGGKFAINGQPFLPPSVPVLLQILSGAATPSSLLPSGSILSITPGAVVELTIPGGGAGSPHPFHLHGHTFDVVRSAGSTTTNYVNPVRRDVVSLGTSTSDLVTIRFKADNPGPWILHCHIDWHFDNGLAIVIAEDAADWNTSIAVPAAWNQLCPLYNAAPASSL